MTQSARGRGADIAARRWGRGSHKREARTRYCQTKASSPRLRGEDTQARRSDRWPQLVRGGFPAFPPAATPSSALRAPSPRRRGEGGNKRLAAPLGRQQTVHDPRGGIPISPLEGRCPAGQRGVPWHEFLTPLMPKPGTCSFHVASQGFCLPGSPVLAAPPRRSPAYRRFAGSSIWTCGPTGCSPPARGENEGGSSPLRHPGNEIE